MHWFSSAQAVELFGDIFQSLGPVAFFCLWNRQERSRSFVSGNTLPKEQPSQHKLQDWLRFWSRVNAPLGCEYGAYVGEPVICMSAHAPRRNKRRIQGLRASSAALSARRSWHSGQKLARSKWLS
jgi:hypothetical protein